MSNKINKKLGEKIRELRVLKNLSQEELADLTQLDRTYISGIERGIRNPTIRTLQIITNGLGTTLSKLVEGIK